MTNTHIEGFEMAVQEARGPKANAVVIIVPGAGGMSYPDYAEGCRDLAIQLSGKGFTAVNFNPHGYGNSTGLFDHSTCVADIIQISEWAVSAFSPNHVFAHARSAGCGILLRASARGAKLSAIGLWGCPARISPFYQPYNVEDSLQKYLIVRGVRPQRHTFVQNIIDANDEAERVTCPVLLAGSTADSYVDTDVYMNMFHKFPSPLKRLVLETGYAHMVNKSQVGLARFAAYCRIFTDFFTLITDASKKEST